MKREEKREFFIPEDFCEWADGINWKQGLGYLNLSDEFFNRLRIRMLFNEFEYDEYGVEFPITEKVSDIFRREIELSRFTKGGEFVEDAEKTVIFLKSLESVELVVVFDDDDVYGNMDGYPKTMTIGRFQTDTGDGEIDWFDMSEKDKRTEITMDAEYRYPDMKKKKKQSRK